MAIYDEYTIKPTRYYGERICPACSSVFEATDKRQKYCDDVCRVNYHNDKLKTRMKELRQAEKAGRILPTANIDTPEGRKQLILEVCKELGFKETYNSEMLDDILYYKSSKSLDEIRAQLLKDFAP